MKNSPHQKEIVRRANELGYFPTPAKAKQISALSCEEYAKQMNARGLPPNPFNMQVCQECDDWAIAVVMEGRTRFEATLTGAADAALADKVREALDRASGKTLRVHIEEV